MKKIRKLFLAALLLPMSMLAANTTLVVELANGQTANFMLQDKPTLTVDGTQLNISTDIVQASYERADVKRFYFTTEAASVKEVSKNTLVFRQIDADHLEISGLGQDDRITVYNMAGSLIGSVSRSQGTAVVSLSGHQKGAYLVKVGNSQTIKFIKK